MSHDLTPEEQRRYERDGFVVREGVLYPAELADLRAAAEHTSTAAGRLAGAGRPYLLDGNRFVDAEGATIQFEHSHGSDSAGTRIHHTGFTTAPTPTGCPT